MSGTRPWGSPQWQLLTSAFGSGGAGLPEAPTDGQLYSRQGSTASWVVSPSGGGGAVDWSTITGKPATFPPTLPIPESGVTNLVSDLALKAPLASPVFTGNPLAPTPTAGDSDTSIATTAFVTGAISTAGAAKEPVIAAGLTTQYWRGDKSWQVLDKTAVGLSNVDNTSDLSKPISTATATALAGKEPTIAAGTVNDYWRGDKTWQPLKEEVEDRVAALLVAGANVALTYDDLANTLTIASSGGGGGGIAEAPSDGSLYGRLNLAWAKGVKLAGDIMTGALSLPSGGSTSATTLNFGTANTGLYGSATSMVLAVGGAAQLSITGGTITVGATVWMPATGTAIAPVLNFGTGGTGIYGDTTSVRISTSSSLRATFGSQLTMAVPIILPAGSAGSSSLYFTGGGPGYGVYGTATAINMSIASAKMVGVDASGVTIGPNALPAAASPGITSLYHYTHGTGGFVFNAFVDPTLAAWYAASTGFSTVMTMDKTIGGMAIYCTAASVAAGAALTLQTAFALNASSVTSYKTFKVDMPNATLQLIKGASGQACYISALNGANVRWAIALGDTTAETGSNVGSDLGIYRYNDAGAYVATAMFIARNSGYATFYSGLAVNAAAGVVSLTVTGSAGATALNLTHPSNGNAFISQVAQNSFWGMLAYAPGGSWYGGCGVNLGSVNYSFYGTGNAMLGSGSWAVSDARFKDVKGLHFGKEAPGGLATAAVMAIPVHTYTLKPGGLSDGPNGEGETIFGWLAQEVEPIIPAAVADVAIPREGLRFRAFLRGLAKVPEIGTLDAKALGAGDMTHKTMNDKYMIATLWAAVQELVGRVAALEAQGSPP